VKNWVESDPVPKAIARIAGHQSLGQELRSQRVPRFHWTGLLCGTK